jgi:hypothetical protein
MKYLKKIFENSTDKLLAYIEDYDDILQKDKIWKKHYTIFNAKYDNINDEEFENWKKRDLKDLISNITDDIAGKINSGEEEKLTLLNNTIKFAKNRIEEIKKDCENDIEIIKDIYLNYLEDCISFSDYSIYRNKSELNTFYPYLIELKLVFSKETLKNRKDGQPDGFKITSDEIMDYWKPIYDFFTVLESNEYIPKIKFYQPNGVEMTIIIQKQNEN